MAAGACEGGGPAGAPSSAALSSLLTSEVPTGYVTAAGAAASMDLAAAAPSTLADPARMRQFLAGNDYQGGYVHIYTAGPRYIDELVFQFAQPAESQALVHFEVEQLRSSLGASVDPEPGVPGSYVFTIFATTKQERRPVFCQGVWYALQVYAFQVLTCGPAPGDTALAVQLAERQYADDTRLLPPSGS